MKPGRLLAALVAGMLTVSAAQADDAPPSGPGPNVWSGQWTTNTGGVGFRLVSTSEGVAAISAQGGKPCAQPSDYYRGGYYDPQGGASGKVTGCTEGNEHLVGRYVGDPATDPGSAGNIDITFVPPGRFKGTYTPDSSKSPSPYSGTFKAHFSGDGCCPTTPTATTLSYAMPDRFGIRGSDGLIEYRTTRAEIDSRQWPVDFTIPTCNPGKLVFYTWTVDGKTRPGEPVRDKRCTFEVDVGSLGIHDVEAKGEDGSRYSVQADARDFLIVGLGDSNASGEGTPDIGGAHVRWEDLRCDRSANSYMAQAALGVERHDTKTSVTFVHLACSGATVHEGLLGLYEGINPPHPGAYLPAQLALLPALIGNRPVDAVMISIGVNDLKFGPMTAFCLDEADCPNKPYPDASSKTTLDQWMKEHVAALPAEYDEVAARLTELRIPPSHVYVSQYFDSTRDQNGRTCNPLMRVYGVGTFDEPEAAWAYEKVLVPLNQAIAAAAAKHGWRLISGAQQAFHRHGYCSDTPWITTFTGSVGHQHDQSGTLHANEIGQQIDAKLALRQLLPDLFPGGKPRPVA